MNWNREIKENKEFKGLNVPNVLNVLNIPNDLGRFDQATLALKYSRSA